MLITHIKKWFIRIIILFVFIFCLAKSAYSQGPVISSVNINSCVGEIRISVTNGVIPYTFAWEDSGGNPVGGNSFLLNGIGADDYRITVTDGNGDMTTAVYTVTDPPDLVGSVVVNDVSCKGGADAQVVVTMANGNPDYAWVLTNSASNIVGTGNVGGTIITIGGLGVDNYQLIVTDEDGCAGVIGFSVTEPVDFLGANLVSQTDATCSDLANGSLEVVGTGGWGNYTYQWYTEPGGAFLGNGASINSLLPGNYRVYITDDNGCVVDRTYTIDSPDPIAITPSVTDASCNAGNDGSIDITVIGGNGGYTYSWSNGATSEDISGLTAGNYTVTITDNLGCNYSETFTVGEPNALAINPTITDVKCFGNNSGRIRTNPSGGTAPYTYLWSTGHTGRNLNNQTAGSYSVTITDKNGCTVSGTYTINEPAAALSVQSVANSSPSCFGANDGSLNIVMQGGTAPYSYSWSNGASTANPTGLTSGTYTLTVTDNNGCTFTDSYTVTDPPQIIVTPTVLTEPTCNGGANGSITVLASNGTGPYTYDWGGGNTGPTLSNVPAGTYTVTVTDNGTTCSTTQNVTLGEPDLIVANAVVEDISCNGQVDGSITLAPTGGTGGYTYLWNTGATTDNISGLTAGSYSVTITDASACSVFESFTIAEPDPLTSTVVKQDVLCKGQSTGSIDLSPADGTAPYSFLWSNGATSEDLTNVPAGNYSVTITDASGCSIVKAITIDEPTEVLALSGTATNVTCNGSANGSIDFEVTGGVAPYSYSWNTGAVSQDLSNLSPGVYTVQVTDANGCIKFDSFTITQPAALAVNPSKTDITCNGANDGIINLNVSGGTAPYTYLWNDGYTGQNRTGLSAANYTVTITDANGCQNIQNITISEPLVLSVTSVKQDVLCFGDASGVANITVSGGTLPYSYSWSNGDITEDLNGVLAGSYTVTITDAKGCVTTETVQINQPASSLSFTPTVGQITCNGAADGAISLNVSGGTAPYTYNWSNGSTSQNLSGLSPGTYSVIIRDVNNCQVTGSYDITDPPILNLSGTETDITCFGANDGKIDITVSGGEAPYTFVWSNGDNTEDVSGLAPGAYTVQVIDNRGCSISKNFNLSQPTALNIAYTKADVNCFGGNDGSIDLTVTGGTAPYSYSWDSGQAQADITDLVAGTYTVTVTDGNGCQFIESIVIDEPAAALSITNTVTDLSCFGSNNGSIALVTSGGTEPYTYAWSNGKTTRDIFGLTPGAYQVTVTDANGCSLQETFNITMPTALAVTASTSNLSCNGTMNGAIDLTVTGGTAPYTYGWNNGETTEDLTNISGGTYQVFITDANGCSLTRTYTITEPLALVANITKQDVTCFGQGDGDIDVTISGGIAPYTYSWSNGAITKDLANISGGTYTLTVTDNNGCQTIETVVIDEPLSALAASGTSTNVSCFGGNDGTVDLTVSGGTAPYTYAWNNGRTTEDVAGLTAGNYQVIVTDARGCTMAVPFTIGSPTLMQANASISNITCNGADDGAIDLTVSGGTAPYTFLWSNGETTEDLSAQTPGNYSVQITDANGCVISRSFQITEPAAMQLTYTQTDVLCFGNSTGAIDITVTGGVGGYTYAWSNGATSEDLSNLTAGNYSVTITDVNGCSVSQNIQITQPLAALAVSETKTNLTCFGANDGTIDLTVTGGTAPYAYAWSNGKTTQDNFNIAAGVYDVTITDANGCSIQKSYNITSPYELTLSGTTSDISCFGAADGAINITATGGTAPYTFVWSNGAGTEDISGLSPGNYSVQITDANGCTKAESFTITQPAFLQLTYSQTDVLCFGNSTGAIDITVTGGVSGYTYTWSNGATSEDLSNLTAGNYSVTVTDVNGCSVTQNIQITQPLAALAVSETITNLTCFGANDGTIDLTVTGGTAPYAYAWSNGKTTEDNFNVAAGVYDVTITDANGCSIQKSYTIASPDELTLSGTTNNISCFGAADGAINISATGGTAPYTFVWSNGAGTEDISGLSPGNYSVQITDANGCTKAESFTITEPTVRAFSHSKVDVSCFGGSDASINISIVGGTAPYTYAWSNGATSEDISGLSAGDYTVVVTDVNGCQISQTINVVEPVAALTTVESITNLTCFGANDGSIELLVTGGTAPYTYNWNNGSSTEDIYAQAAGAYQVTITDANGCSIQGNYSINTPDPLTSIGTSQNISCNGLTDGSINLTVTGGTEPYVYSWSNGETTEDLSNLAIGSYQVQVTDAQGCSISRNFNITQPLPLTLNYVSNNVSCFQAGDGNITTQVSGGTAPYTYAWNNGATTKNISALTGGSYELTVTDANGCQTTQTITITEPSSALNAAATITDAGCNGLPNARIDLTVTGGTAPYNYLWSNGSVQRDLVNVFAGNYQVTVTDRIGCTFSASYTIDQPNAIIADLAVTNTTCFGDTDGSIIVTPSGGTAPYTYIWSNGATSKDLINVAGGTYNLTITDANNCSSTASVEIGDSRNLNVSIQKTDVLCKGESNGAIVLNVTGGSGAYTYVWDNGSEGKVLTNLSAGVYSVLISDAAGCATTASIVISEPALALGVIVDRTQEFACFGDNTGFANAIPSGGVAPYTYLWSNGARTRQINNLSAGNYTVSVTDANGCLVQQSFSIQQPAKPVSVSAKGGLQLSCAGDGNGAIELNVEGGTSPYTYLWSTGSTASKIENLTAGDYTVRVSDAKGCITEKVFSVEEPSPLVIADARVNESQCFDDRNGSISLDVSGGVFPYTYQWSNGATTKNLVGITAGTFTVEITDANGCSVQGVYTLSTPERFIAAPSISEISCVGANDASISLNIEGGIDPVSIQWNTGANSEVITDLAPGQYNVLITDKKGCTIQKLFNIIEPLPLTLDAYIEDAARCNDPKSGRINVIVSGGREPYSYRWNNGETGSELVDVLPGTYVVTVSDRYGCEVQGTYIVQQPEPLRIGLTSVREVDCENRIAGVRVKANVTGGFGNYTYNWSLGSSSNNEIFLTQPGRLNLEILDDRGCVQSKAIDISIPEFGEAEFSYNAESLKELGDLAANDPVNFYDESVGNIIDWDWDFGDGFDSDEIDPIHTYDAPGTYTVTLITTDDIGCTSSKTTVLEITEGYRIMAPTAFSPNGDGNNDYFRPRFLGLTTIQFSVFNTWGELVFSTSDLETKGWDGIVKGLPAENGNYVYKISGFTQNGLKVERNGVFALIK